ncbi:MAG: divalent-cation tolerance protein CutA [Candidatus Heimdallarchaeaceae archaeon]
MKDNLIQVQTTVLTEKEARTIALIMNEEKLSASVQFFPIVSIYNWNGQSEESEEFLIIIKSTQNKFEKIKKRLKELHSYELPQITSIKIDNYTQEYFDWIVKETRE